LPKPSLRRRIAVLLSALVLANALVWLWALAQFHAQPLMLGTAVLAWGLGLRHAVDADHIAAIDNVTRKLMQQGQRPIAVGLWFAVGHATIIAIASIVVALTATALAGFDAFREVGGIIATTISALFLFAIAAMNLVILRGVWRTFAHVRAGGAYVEEDLDLLLSGRGLLARLFRPMFRLVTRVAHGAAGFPVRAGVRHCHRSGAARSFRQPGRQWPGAGHGAGAARAVCRRHGAGRHHRRRGHARRL
jgi:high-affinity nickel-transport protein